MAKNNNKDNRGNKSTSQGNNDKDTERKATSQSEYGYDEDMD